MKKLYMDHYADGFCVEHIGCLDLSVACASGYYNIENYYFYCFLYGVFKQKVDEKTFVMDDIAKLLGIKIINVHNLKEFEIITHIIESIDSGCPVLVALSYSAIFYDKTYKKNNSSHYMIVSGYDKEKELLILHDSLVNRQSVKVILNDKVDVFTDFNVTYDIFLDMWQKSQMLGINRLVKLAKEDMGMISSYGLLVKFYLENEKNKIQNYDVLADFDCEKLPKDKIRRRLFNSMDMMVRVLMRAFESETCLGFDSYIIDFKKKSDDILYLRNKLTQKALKEIIKCKKISSDVIEELKKNDKCFYELVEWAYDHARFVNETENLSLNALVTADSEVDIAPSQNVISGSVKDDKDCWLSDYKNSTHWIIVDLRSQYELEHIVIKHHPYNQSLVTASFDVLVSCDNKNWQLVKSFVENEDKVNMIKTNKNARYVKLFIKKSNKINENSVRLFGIDIYEKRKIEGV